MIYDLLEATVSNAIRSSTDPEKLSARNRNSAIISCKC